MGIESATMKLHTNVSDDVSRLGLREDDDAEHEDIRLTDRVLGGGIPSNANNIA